MNAAKSTNSSRLILAALILILGAYWVGARFAPRQPEKVEAVPLGGSNARLAGEVGAPDAALTEEGVLNARISPPASPALPNILTKATQYEFFMEPVPLLGPGC